MFLLWEYKSQFFDKPVTFIPNYHDKLELITFTHSLVIPLSAYPRTIRKSASLRITSPESVVEVTIDLLDEVRISQLITKTISNKTAQDRITYTIILIVANKLSCFLDISQTLVVVYQTSKLRRNFKGELWNNSLSAILTFDHILFLRGGMPAAFRRRRISMLFSPNIYQS